MTRIEFIKDTRCHVGSLGNEEFLLSFSEGDRITLQSWYHDCEGADPHCILYMGKGRGTACLIIQCDPELPADDQLPFTLLQEVSQYEED
jgi:hypothetical protein